MDVPEGWFLAGSAPGDYEVTRAAGEGGGLAYALRATAGAPRGFGTLMQEFVPEGLRGRRVRLSASLKCDAVAGRGAIWMRVDGPKRHVLAFDNMAARPVRGTTGWARHDVVLDVAPEAEVLAFGVLLDGAGSASVGAFTLEAVGDDVPTTGTPREMPRAPRNLDFAAGRGP